MGNYSLVVNSKFKPFSYEEMLQPVQMATLAHQDVENEYAELAAKANILEGIVNEQTDPYAYKMQKSYLDNLKTQAETLAREGLNPTSRQGMLNMKSRYSSDIIPIEQAYTRRRQLADKQRELLAQDNTLMFNKDASTYSLDELIKNPELSYKSYSGAELAKQVGTAAANLSKEMRENPRKWRSILGNQYFETIMQKGYRPEDIIQVMQENPNASTILKSIVEDAVGSSNIASWGDDNILNRAYEYARQGLWNAVGETQYQQVSNKAYDYAMQDELAKKKADRAKEDEDENRMYYRTVPKSTGDKDKKTTQINADLQVLREILANPALLDQASTKTVREPHMVSADPQTGIMIDTGTGPTRQETYYPYEEKLDELSKRYGDVSYTLTDGKLKGGNLEELAQKLENDIRSSVVRAFAYKPNITQSDLIIQVLKENIRSYHRRSNSTGLWELNDNKKGDEVDIEDLNNYFTSDADTDFDPDLGFIINATDSNGKTRSAVLDTELLDDQNRTFSTAQEAIKTALDYGEYELATTYIGALMKAFHKRYNTLEKKESNTSSKDEE